MALLKGMLDEIDVRVKAEIDMGLGKTITVPFIATYEKLNREAAAALVEKCKNGEMTDEDCIRRHLRGWRDLKGQNDEEVPFCQEALDEALSNMGYYLALRDGFTVVLFGQKLANTKN